MMTAGSIRAAKTEDLAAIQSLLREAGLPFEDLRPEMLSEFVVVEDQRRNVVGAGGIERHAAAGLLRSVVVDESLRGTGMGQRITRAIEQRAAEQGVHELYLLTTTAAEFFPRLGYVRVERAEAPEAIRSSAEFASLCPASAVCMRKDLLQGTGRSA